LLAELSRLLPETGLLPGLLAELTRLLPELTGLLAIRTGLARVLRWIGHLVPPTPSLIR
jgi:hypothetical protein